MEGSSNLRNFLLCGLRGCCLRFCWFGFGGRRLCEPGRPGCNRARAESVPANPTTENRKTLKSNAGRCFESIPHSPQPQHKRPSFRRVPFKRPYCRRAPFTVRGPILALREHRLHVFCAFCVPAVLLRVLVPRLPAKTYSTSG